MVIRIFERCGQANIADTMFMQNIFDIHGNHCVVLYEERSEYVDVLVVIFHGKAPFGVHNRPLSINAVSS
jgi:hypothetical protein